jgi:hypothetical protein
MTEYEARQLILEYEFEWEKTTNEQNEEDVLVRLWNFELINFINAFHSYFDDKSVNVVIHSQQICIWMNDICDFYGFDIDYLFKD